MDNQELATRLDAIVEALEGIENSAAVLTVRQVEPVRELEAPRVATGWPWTPNTVTQGFLATRWLRRDGNVYAAAARRGLPGPNSPIRGGDDSQAKVSVPSGAPRS